ncbi:MAG: anthranilate phosphoribosyltransferase [Candidatus Xenobia bacterium]
MREVLEALCNGAALSREESRQIFEQLVAGALNEIEIAALLVALKARGETPEILAGAAQALRAAAAPFPRPEYEVADPCGTGGDGQHTVNVSTAVAIVLAEMGLPVAKHGNRSVSSHCGSADVLEAIGLPVESAPEVARRVLDACGICFLFAPQYHGGLRHAMPVRRTLKTRTIFNLLGPLVNPASPPWQVVGVYDAAWCRPLAETLGMLGCRGALVVHGSGLDEIAVHGPTTAARWHDGLVEELIIRPDDLHPLEALRGGDAEFNAGWMRALLSGQGSTAAREVVALNAAAMLWISGRADSIDDGVKMGRELLATRRGLERLERWKEACHGA